MADVRKDLIRRCLPFAEWPAPDRVAWTLAIMLGNLIDGAGPASHWKPLTRKKVMAAYGRWLTFLTLTGRLEPQSLPAQRCTEANLRVYVEMLRCQVTSTTMA